MTILSSSSLCKIVTIGGGNGQQTLLSGLRDLSNIAITAVVSMTDSGGSTGRLRDELGTLPPGDVLKCILALSPYPKTTLSLLQKRFLKDERLRGHNAGNMLLTMLSRYTGSFTSGVNALAEILDTKGVILPVTTDKATLVAILTDGTRIYGESAIDTPTGNQRQTIENVFLVPHHTDHVRVYPPVVDALKKADYIILGPGDLFTSIIPNLIVPGVFEAIQNGSAKLIYIINIMTKFGETHNFKINDFVRQLEKFTPKPIDIVVHNSKKPNKSLRDLYAIQRSEFVEINPADEVWKRHTVYSEDLLETNDHFIRHAPQKLARLLETICCT